jgi:hypothetical protein
MFLSFFPIVAKANVLLTKEEDRKTHETYQNVNCSSTATVFYHGQKSSLFGVHRIFSIIRTFKCKQTGLPLSDWLFFLSFRLQHLYINRKS